MTARKLESTSSAGVTAFNCQKTKYPPQGFSHPKVNLRRGVKLSPSDSSFVPQPLPQKVHFGGNEFRV